MNRHERRKAKVMQSAIARANKKAVGMVCIEEIIRDPNTCVEDFLSRLSAIVNKLGDSDFAIVVEPGKVVHFRRHTRSARSFGLWSMMTRFLSQPNVSSLLRNTLSPLLMFTVNLSTATSETACGSVDGSRSRVILD